MDGIQKFGDWLDMKSDRDKRVRHEPWRPDGSVGKRLAMEP